MAERHCITCGKEVYMSKALATDAERWYHREGSTRLCYPDLEAKPDSDPAMAIFTRDMIDRVTDKAIEELETHLVAHPDLLRRVEALERITGDYSKAIGRLNQRIDSAWNAFRNHRRSKRAHGI